MATDPTTTKIVARKSASVPLEPDSGAWDALPPYRVDLLPQRMATPMGGGAAKRVDVRALHDGSSIGIHLAWTTKERDAGVLIDRFRDACAVMFPALPGTSPSFFMGDKGQPVVIWQWKPDWEDPDAQEKTRTARYPSYGDYYVPENDRVSQGYGDRPREDGPANVIVAEGFGSATRTNDPDLEVKSLYRDEAWRVVFRRPIAREYPSLSPGIATIMNVAVWEGSAQEVGPRKSVSLSWHDLEIEGATPSASGGKAGIPSLGATAVAATTASVAWAIRRRMRRDRAEVES